ncbi:LPS assembly lipoprotein LptE [Bosea psychrotolerans]|uniref:LPS-assembly lipoprotein n=1 Tax=Bosea psychrotolerans TaxID=1871628 RepID=A0A2S4LSN2_9HYPH|nr:LPS assembly lipoprotein LptE [Bosea psychrotolerans]POR45463.1 LPS-assembly lipoprotein [Bosea psychrotolerans]
MSSPEAQNRTLSRPVPTRRMMLTATLLATAFAGGCLQPLYSENTTSTVGGSVKSALKSVEIPQISGLTGHYLRNELAFELDGGGEPDVQKRLRFEAKVAESIEVVTVDYNTGRADSAVLIATATWTVKRIGSGETVSSGTNVVRAPYERSSQRFATVRAARDAQIRAAKSLAQLIKGQLAADLVSG